MRVNLAIPALAIFAALNLAASCVEGQSTRISGAVDMAGYTLELAECRKKGREAKSYEVYEACALEADKKHKVNGQ